jgi:HPt (histidine-containing phosphotransfer) domain-containing protein
MEKIKRYELYPGYARDLFYHEAGRDCSDEYEEKGEEWCKSADVTALEQRCEELETDRDKYASKVHRLELEIIRKDADFSHGLGWADVNEQRDQIAALKSRLEDAEKLVLSLAKDKLDTATGLKLWAENSLHGKYISKSIARDQINIANQYHNEAAKILNDKPEGGGEDE